MGFKNRYDGIDEYAARIIRIKARQLVGRAGFTADDREDLEQEMVIDLLQRLPKYDPRRAKRNTFIARIVEHKVASLVEARKAAKRDYRLCTCSLNDEFENQNGETTERGDKIEEEDHLLRTGKLSRPKVELRDLSIDLERVVAGLPPELRELCERLKSQSISEISRETGVPRTTIYESVKKLRALFEDAGLKDYL